MFEGYGSAKSVRMYVCQTGSFMLWMAVMSLEFDKFGHRVPVTREKDMKLAREFPYGINPDCRCKWCRYARMTKNWSNL